MPLVMMVFEVVQAQAGRYIQGKSAHHNTMQATLSGKVSNSNIS